MKRILCPSILIFCVLLGLASCVTPNILLSPDLIQKAQVMDVEGRLGWLPDRHLSFGPYFTQQMHREAIYSETEGFWIQKTQWKHALGFVLQGPKGAEARVRTLGTFVELDETVFPWMDRSFEELSLYAGSVDYEGMDDSSAWDFFLHDPEGGKKVDGDDGLLRSRTGDVIRLRAVKEIEGQVMVLPRNNVGFEFFEKGEAIGAVSLLNAGRVWIREDLPQERQQVLAALSAALLVRERLEEQSNHF